jgi:hypothetical protein
MSGNRQVSCCERPQTKGEKTVIVQVCFICDTGFIFVMGEGERQECECGIVWGEEGVVCRVQIVGEED